MIPLISIVGRPNVGKSTLFNRLVGLRQSIVFSEPGSTRDLIVNTFKIENKKFKLVDSGGFDKDKGHYPTLIRKKIFHIIKKSNLIIFLLDGKNGLQDEDREILELLIKEKKEFVPVINKIDSKEFNDNVSEFYKLGIKSFITLSAEHNRNIMELRDFIYLKFKHNSEIGKLNEDDSAAKIAIIGKPNVGKSTLINKLANEDISIVSEIAGTTRDTVNIELSRNDKKYIFIDTAGLRRKSKINEKVEYYSTSRAIDTIERSNIIIFLVDSQFGPSKQDAKILNFIKKNNKAIILGINKSDLLPKELNKPDIIIEKAFQFFPQINYAIPIVLSALKGKNVSKLYKMIDSLSTKLKVRININKFNKFLQNLIQKSQAPVDKGRRLKLYYATQLFGEPPSFVLHCNFAKNIPNTYRKFLERSIRKEFGFFGVSIKLSFKTTRNE